MDPVTAAGLALGVAGVGFQVYTGCVQGELSHCAKLCPYMVSSIDMHGSYTVVGNGEKLPR